MTGPDALSIVLAATGRASLEDALSWLADDLTLTPGSDINRLLQALVVIAPDSTDGARALNLTARRVSRSALDSAAVLFRPDVIAPSYRFREALEFVASRSRDMRLVNIDANSVIAAQRHNPFVIETLCVVAGLSFGDLRERVPGLPSDPTGDWTPTQVRDAFALLDDIVSDRVSSPLEGAVATRPLDLMPSVVGAMEETGWAAVELHANAGIPYEVLLSQRAAGGTWLAHRNATSSLLGHRIADRLCGALDAIGIAYRRSTSVGGHATPKSIQQLTGSGKQVGIVVLGKDGTAVYAIALASARDSGTARKSGASLRAMKRAPKLPMAALLSGPGWALRNETGALAVAFGGRLFSDTSLDALVRDIRYTTGLADRP